ncbi:MAG: methyl-accepting chemotaxis protein [Candidatus Kapabacteria bacterium]|jgi:methyl-accepting chemotaxis protein/ligand-binding sensor domain-containing protein|nr:methyl-accepting chemotaxis protein [Candidatus Kapabacteria bacterium]
MVKTLPSANFPTRFGRTVCLSLFVLCWFCLSHTHVTAQTATGLDPQKRLTQYILEVWREDQGLPQNAVQTILQTRDGYLWFGSQEGVVRFDGVRFTVFDKQHTEGIKENNVYALCEDKEGKLWVGTYVGGISVYSKGVFKNYSKEQGIDGDVSTIFQDSKGTIWVGSNNGIFRFNTQSDKFEKVTGNGAPDGFMVSRIKESKDGTLLIATYQGFFTMNNGTFRRYMKTNGLVHERISDVFYNVRNGEIWLATDDGAQKFENGQFTTLYNKENSGMLSSFVLFVYEDSRGNFFVGTNAGLSRIKSGRAETLTDKDGLGSDEIQYIYEDREGSIWIGTSAGGLNRLKNGKFTPFGVPEGLSFPMLWGLFRDSKGDIWIPTNGGGVNQVHNGRVIRVYNDKDGLPTNSIRSIGEGADGTMYFGTQEKGLAKLVNGKLTILTQKDGIAGNFVRVTFQHPDGSLWIGCNRDGLTVLRNGVYTTYTTKDGLPHGTIYRIMQRKDGKIWIATRGGLAIYDNGKFTALTTDQGLSGSVAMAMHEDKDGVLWVGTNGGGISRYKDGKFTAARAKDGMPDDTEYSILEDDNNNLWMTCNKGIIKVSKGDLNKFLDGQTPNITTAVLYGKLDGMRSSECNGGNQFPSIKDSEGKFWFPTVSGAAIIDPNNIPKNTLAPPVVVEELIVDKDIYTPHDGEVTIPAGKTNFEFHFTGLSLLFPGKVRFKYMLEGFDKDWVEAGTRRSAFYTNISPGSYTFKVKACNNDGIWNDTGAELAFYFRPYFYQTWWFGLICLGLVVGGVYQAYRIRIKSAEKREAELNKRIDEMVVDLRTAHEATLVEKESVEKKVEVAVRESESQRQYLASSVEELLQEMTRFASGNLNINLIPKSSDDIGRLYDGFTKAAENIAGMIKQVSESVNTAARESRDISGSVEHMSRAAQQQNMQVTEVRGAINEMAHTIHDTSRNITLVASIATESGENAKEGGKIVEQTIEGINKISAVVQASAHTVQRLGERSIEIGDIIEVINSIANQTNLLALNAAIEAARAGEHGKGFAIVADEVRQLAESTTKATKQITTMVKQIQEDIGETVKIMKQGTRETQAGKRLAEKAGVALGSIIDQTEKVASITTQVAAASEEQAATSEEIRRNVDDMTHTLAQFTKEITEVADAAESLKSLSANLQQLTRKFRID